MPGPIPDPRPFSDHASAEANAWLDYLHSGDADEDGMRRFKEWMEADPENAAAYRKTEEFWRDLKLVEALGEIDISGHIRPRFTARMLDLLKGALARPYGAVAGVAVAACTVFLVIWVFDGLVSVTPDYQTEIAEIRDIVLPDGSVVTLGAKSEIKTDFSNAERRVTLLAGEAFFSVTKDLNRPFYVAADDTVVRVVGTKFDVRRSAEKVRVSVLEGVVEVMRGESVAKAEAKLDERQRLTAGQGIVAKKSQPTSPIQIIKEELPGAWREGRLVYANAPLEEVIADVNRYYDYEIRFGSPSLRDIRVTTAFGIDQIEQMLAVLEATQPLRLRRLSDNKIVLQAEAQGG